MQDQTRARAILAALLLAIAIVGIRAAAPVAGWVPPTDNVVIIIGIALEVMLAGLLVVVRHEDTRGSRPVPTTSRTGPSRTGQNPAIAGPPDDLAARLRVILYRILGTGLVVIPVAIAISLLRKLPTHPVSIHSPTPTPRPIFSPHPTTPSAYHSEAGAILTTIVQVGLIILLVAAVAAIVYAAWLRRTPRLPMTGASDELTDLPDELVRAVESGRRALAELDDARAAIIGCYLAMEASLAKAGAARRAAETPDELLARAVAGDLVNAEPAGRLTELFYEARFSSHPMPQAKRDEAARALSELAEPLPRERPATNVSASAPANGTDGVAR